MLCEACGNENRTGSRFCDRCGSPLSLSCPACGEPNRGDATFCAACGTSLKPPETEPEPPRAIAERRQVTVLFVDLVGFTSFAEGRDPERVRGLQQQYFDAATEIVTRHGGTVEKFIGDAVMAVWGTPVAHEDDAQRAVRAGLEILKSVEALGHDLGARAGIVTGEAAVTLGATNQGMVAGDMVNTAARLQAAADAGHILADQATVQAAQSIIAFEAVDDLHLKGKAGSVRAWRALRVQPARATELVEPPFVGRTEELRRLKDLLHGVGQDRRARLISISGPAGIGKSRLVEELGSYAHGLAEPIYWHTGRSPSYGEGLSFWALGEMIRRRAGLAEGDDEATTRSALSATLEQFVPSSDDREWIEPALLALLGFGETEVAESLFPAWRTFFDRLAERGTTVLVFEDVQWADSGTLEFIEHILDWSRNRPIMAIALARPEFHDSRPGWGTGRSSATTMSLEPLSDNEMSQLLEGLLPGLPGEQVATIVRRAEGMPLYAVEIIRALLGEGRIERRGDAYVPTAELTSVPLPASLRSLIASRLDALSRDGRAALQDASVLGQAFTVTALAAVSAVPLDELERRLRALVRREFLQIEADPRSPERGQYRFVQSLIREVAYDTLALRDRRARHLAAARFLEGSESDQAAGALATHYLAAYRASDEGEEADAVAAQARVSLRAAAERAASLGAHGQAVENLEHAIEITADLAERAHLLERAATSGAIAALPGASSFARAAVDAYRTLGDRVAELKATALLGDVLLDQARIEDADRLLSDTISQLGDRTTWGEGEASIFAVQSRAKMRLDDNDSALTAAENALILSERLELARVTVTALLNKGSTLSQAGRRVEGLALLEAAVRLAQRNAWSHLELRARNNYAMTLGDASPLDALTELRAAMELAERIGDMALFGTLSSLFIDYSLGTGRPDNWEQAIRHLERALPLATPGVDLVNLWTNRVFTRAMRGHDVSDDVTVMDRLVDESTDPRARPLRHMVRAWQQYAAGRWPDAAAAARAAMEIEPWVAAWFGFLVAVPAADEGDLATIEWVGARLEEVPLRGPLISASRTVSAAIAAAARRDRDTSVELFLSGTSAHRALGMLLEVAHAGYAAATLLPGEPRLAALVAESRSIFEAVAARPMVEWVDRAWSGETNADLDREIQPDAAEAPTS